MLFMFNVHVDFHLFELLTQRSETIFVLDEKEFIHVIKYKRMLSVNLTFRKT